MKIFFLSGNRDKIKEAAHLLSKSGIEVRGRKIRFREPVSLNLEDIVVDKAKQASRVVKGSFLVDDAGIFFKAYPNFPGAFTKHVFELLGFEGVLKLLEGKDRTAFFKTVVAYRDPENRIFLFKGMCKGTISPTLRGAISPFSPFNSVFIPAGSKETFSEMSIDDRAAFSHRARALEKLIRNLNKKDGRS